MTETLVVGQPNVIALEALTDQTTGTPVTDATVTHTLTRSDGAVVAGEAARACAHVTGGTYRATIPNTATLVAGAAYRGTYHATIGGDVVPFLVSYVAVANDV
jgi:hypothetical protein